MRSQPNHRATWASGDDTGAFFFVVFLVCSCFFAYLLWTTYHATIRALVMQAIHYEIGIIQHFSHQHDLADRQMAAADPHLVTLHDLYGITHDVGAFFRIPAAVLMVILGAPCAMRAAPARFKRAFDLNGLLRELATSSRPPLPSRPDGFG